MTAQEIFKKESSIGNGKITAIKLLKSEEGEHLFHLAFRHTKTRDDFIRDLLKNERTKHFAQNASLFESYYQMSDDNPLVLVVGRLEGDDLKNFARFISGFSKSLVLGGDLATVIEGRGIPAARK